MESRTSLFGSTNPKGARHCEKPLFEMNAGKQDERCSGFGRTSSICTMMVKAELRCVLSPKMDLESGPLDEVCDDGEWYL